MSNLYRVTDWEEHFENNRTRNMKIMQWIPVPNKHDGDGYTELVDRDDGAEMLGAWLAILQVASKCQERGTLVRDNGTPHTPKTISRLTRLKESSIEKAFCLLCSEEIAWLQVVDNKQQAGGCQEGDRQPAPSAHPTDEEGNGMEGKEENIVDGASAPLCKVSFVLKSGASFQIKNEDYLRWKETHRCNVDDELLKASDWLCSNPAKRKTATGMPRFISSWLSRASETKPTNAQGERMVRLPSGEMVKASDIRF